MTGPARLKPYSVPACRRVHRNYLMKTYLSVPFEEKDCAKNMGARWDPARKRWYVPDGVDLTPFLPWVPDLAPLDRRIKRVLKRRVR